MKEINRNMRLPVMLNDDELAAITDYQFETRLQNRSEAVRELIRLGLAAHHKRTQDDSEP